MDFASARVVIFGGSRGLGLVMAREFGREGAHVAIAARDPDELARARADLSARRVPAMTIQCDVRDRTQVESAIAQAVDAGGRIDVLVNNAGVIQVGPIEHMTVRDFEDAMATHFFGPLYAVLAAVPHMRRGGARRIVNISSIGGKVAVPHLVPYVASKFALTGLSEGLRAELAADGFSITTVLPGLMRTGSPYNARFKGRHHAEFAWFHVADSLPGITVGAERAARQIVDACRYGDPELIITPWARLAVLLKGVFPSTLARTMSAANRLLPAPAGNGAESRSGWQSTSRWVPSFATRFSDRASVRNNEVPTTAS